MAWFGQTTLFVNGCLCGVYGWLLVFYTGDFLALFDKPVPNGGGTATIIRSGPHVFMWGYIGCVLLALALVSKYSSIVPPH